MLKDTHYKHREACVKLNCGQNEIIRVFELRHDKENRGVRDVKTEGQVGQAPNEDEPLAVTERMLDIQQMPNLNEHYDVQSEAK